MVANPQQLNEELDQLRKLISEGATAREALKADYHELETRNQKLVEQIALMKTSAEVHGSDSEMRAYIETDAEVVSEARRHFVQSDEGALQLTGAHIDGVGWRSGLLDDQPRNEWQRRLQQYVEERNIVRLLKSAAQRIDVSRVSTPKMDRRVRDHLARAPRELRIFTSGTAASGGDWVPERFLPTLARALEVAPRVTNIFQAMDFPTGTDTLEIPTLKTVPRPYTHAIPTADDPAADPLSTFTTGKHLIGLISHVVGYQVDRDSSEDSFLAVLPIVRERLIKAFLVGEADAIFNGDTAGTQDALATWDIRGLFGAATGANDRRRGYDGLRKRALARAGIDWGGLAAARQGTTKEVLDLVKQLDVTLSTDDQSVVIIASPEQMFRMYEYSDLEGNASHQLSPAISGNIGGAGGGLPNQRGVLYGRYPVVVDPMLSADLNASGVFDNVTTTKTCMLAVAPAQYKRWVRSQAVIESEIDIRNNTATMVARNRHIFAELADPAWAEKNVAVMYNIPNA